ncbi:hypothetical protein Tco_0588260 [Tanacetum coccineum]
MSTPTQCCDMGSDGYAYPVYDMFGIVDPNMQNEVSRWSPSSVIGFKTPIDMLKFFGCIASIKQGMFEPVKVKCIFLAYIEGIMGNKLWRLDDVTSKVVLYRNMGFNESGEYKKTFIGSGVARDREQQSARKLFRYKEDSNEAAFAVAVVEKIYAHESLTLNDTVACDEYQVVCTKPDIASSDVGMLDESDRGLQTGIQVFVDFNYAMRRSISVMSRSFTRVREAELTLVAVVATDALIEAIPGPRFQYWLKLLRVGEG